MTMEKPIWCLALLASLGLAGLTSHATAQDNSELDRDDWSVASGNWGIDDHWADFTGFMSITPSLDFERWALIANGGVATIDDAQDTGAVELNRGEIAIVQGGSLKVDTTSLTNGNTVVGRSGTLRLSDNGSFEGTNVAIHDGILEMAASSSFAISGDLTTTGELRIGVDGANSAILNVGGVVSLGGIIAPSFNGNPAFGDNFQFIRGADSINVDGASVALPEGASLERGLGVRLNTGNGNAAVVVDNLPILSVNRVTGAAEILNVTGDAIDLVGYSVFSGNGLLSQSSWQSLASQNAEGWREATPRDEALAELNLTAAATLDVGAAGLSIGSPFVAGPTHPTEEDLRFEVSFADGTVVDGLVEYVGAPNDLTLRVDPATGEAEISHQSSFIDPFEITGYSILSESGSLQLAGWNKIGTTGDDWLTANPDTDHLAEISPAQSTVFGNGTEHALGAIFNPAGQQDLVFEFATASGGSLTGTVVYGELSGGTVTPLCQAPNSLAGDLNGDGAVSFPDFLTLSANFAKTVSTHAEGDVNCDGSVNFPDFLALSANFGKTLGATAAVPEPGSFVLFGFGVLGLFQLRRRR